MVTKRDRSDREELPLSLSFPIFPYLPFSSLSGSSVSPGIDGREMKEEEIICNRWKELASGEANRGERRIGMLGFSCPFLFPRLPVFPRSWTSPTSDREGMSEVYASE